MNHYFQWVGYQSFLKLCPVQSSLYSSIIYVTLRLADVEVLFVSSLSDSEFLV